MELSVIPVNFFSHKTKSAQFCCRFSANLAPFTTSILADLPTFLLTYQIFSIDLLTKHYDPNIHRT